MTCDKGVLHALSQHRIAPPAVLGSDLAADLIDQAFLSYNAGRLREVCRVFTRKMLEPRLHGRAGDLGGADPRRARDELPDPPDPGRVRRLDRLHRRQPLPRHPLRPRPAPAPEPPEPGRPPPPPERHHPDLRHRLRLCDPARHRRLLSRVDRGRAVRADDGHGRVPSRGGQLPPRAIGGAGPAGQQPARRGLRGRGADLHLEPRRQLDRDEPGRAAAARGPAPDRPAPRRQRDGRPSSTTPSATGGRRASSSSAGGARRTSSSRPSRRSRRSSAWPRAATITSCRSPTPGPTRAGSRARPRARR